MNKFIAVLLSLVLFGGLTASGQTFTSETVKKAMNTRAQGDTGGALKILAEAIEKGRDLLEVYQYRAGLRSATGDMKGAVDDYSAAIAINPAIGHLYDRRAFFRHFLRDNEGALKDYGSAISLGVKSDRVYLGRARVKRDIGDLQGALDDAKTALSFTPDHAGATHDIAVTYERMGDTASAIAVLQAFVDNDNAKASKISLIAKPTGESIMIERPGNQASGDQTFLSGTGYKTVARSLEEAERMGLEREQLMNTANIYIRLARLYSKNNDQDKAVVICEKGIALDPQNPTGYRLRSELRMAKGDLAGVISDLKTMIDLPLNAPDINVDRGILLILQGKDAEAEPHFESYLQRFPTARRFVDTRIAAAKALRDIKK